jgi:TRAP-type mannitol/chloroaromatic compound transport system permease large subunit
MYTLGCFLDFFEIAIVVLPLLAPIALNMGIDLVWLGVLVAINLQTSYLTPPFGFALFFLRGVAPLPGRGNGSAGVTTADIHWGALPFVAVQLLVMALVIAFPALVLGGLDRPPPLYDDAGVQREVQRMADQGARETPDPRALLLDSMKER